MKEFEAKVRLNEENGGKTGELDIMSKPPFDNGYFKGVTFGITFKEPVFEAESPHGKWIKELKEVPITGGIMHQPYWSCPRCGRKWEAYSAQFITFCSKCGLELIDGDCEEGDRND